MESYGVISLHELEGNGVSHVFELAWISVRGGTLTSSLLLTWYIAFQCVRRARVDLS